MQKIKVKGQSVQKIKWQQTGRRMDGGDCITSRANVAGNYVPRQCQTCKIKISLLQQPH